MIPRRNVATKSQRQKLDQALGRLRQVLAGEVHRVDAQRRGRALAKAAAQGKRLKTAVLTAHVSGDSHNDFFKLTLKDVLIT